jgi:hypothetical protein
MRVCICVCGLCQEQGEFVCVYACDFVSGKGAFVCVYACVLFVSGKGGRPGRQG